MQYQKPVLIQEQRLKLSPQMLQSIQLMALPITELKLRIAEEIERNPALEVLEDRSQVSYEEIDHSTRSEEYDFFENSSDPGYSKSYDSEASDAKQKFLEGAIARSESLHDHLLWQLRLQPLDEEDFAVGEKLILNLDDNGFHIEPIEELFPDSECQRVRRMIALIHEFEPTGICVADFRESLLLQISLDPEAPPYADDIVANHLPALEKNRIQEIARDLSASVQEIEEAVAFIRRLTPFPGRLYSNETPHYVVPDVSVRLEEGEFKIYLNDIEIPVLGISAFYAGLQNGKKHHTADHEKSAQKFAGDHVREAEWFINSIRQRNRSLMKIAKAIIEFQRDFFLKGPKYLVPLTLKDIAEEVSVHETTVSRIANAKYMQTEWGIYPIKYFFTNSISGAGSSGSRFSKEGVKEMIREILENDTGKKRLSDQKISDLLKEKGVSIARRTVAKYRNELNIDSSFDR
ncbi:RNA polymerase factor sigma-54 [Sediminispirochaeta smaragdinae]|uniref:RNA polymerase, sigma 54 subunit, RpoN n=1 Tax=Sediminispirochaeta smaragdinae (strain DSM 11293 / JCM 15392 / SEBR 4228) TaxID=573413 RepID=E1R9G1_SEDSS|nr:RNA polymerase factor sigma-54 [Sediminispirochaeta smaragdinae]ADK83130.1 RNA polymerase, sigma 54 subunit, RpoN [Sediminispirochaeta smaragdinae DSM 11293]